MFLLFLLIIKINMWTFQHLIGVSSYTLDVSGIYHRMLSSLNIF